MKTGIKARLLGGFVAITMLGTFAVVIVLVVLTSIINDLERIVGVTDALARSALRVQYEIATMSDDIRGYMLDPSNGATRESMRTTREEMAREIASIEKIAPESMRETAQKLNAVSVQKIFPLQDSVIQTATSSDVEVAKGIYFEQYSPLQNEAEALATRLGTIANAEMTAALARAGAARNRMRITAIVLLVAFISLGLGLSFFLARSLSTPIVDMARSMASAASGHLDDRPHFDNRRDELGQLSRSINATYAYLDDMSAVAESISSGDLTVKATPRSAADRFGNSFSAMLTRLTEVITDVRRGAAGLRSAASQIANSSQDLSQGTSEQAASVEETTASLEQMTSSITQNAESTRIMEQMARQGVRDADESGRTVSETVQAMNSIAQKITIIEEIAYQTNLLALNAAIEAARAGDHGRGFAVVATEVRKLAERSQLAAKEIGELAAGSVKVAEKSGHALLELVPAIRRTADLVQEVAAASNEQAGGVAQINRALAQVQQVTQRSATAAEELSGTAEELASHAESLDQRVAFFRVEDSPELFVQHAAAAPPALRATRQPMPAAARIPIKPTADALWTKF
jgi:methyl-accepting chemotaxis protein